MDAIKEADYKYIVEIIAYLDRKHHIRFFITPEDFDQLYNWWLKNIPLFIVKEAIDILVERWGLKNKKITGFRNFNYQVKKNHRQFMELHVGTNVSQACSDHLDESDSDRFLNNFPEALISLRSRFEAIFDSENYSDAETRKRLVDEIQSMLLERFTDDPELNQKSKRFMLNLNPAIRTAKIEQRYRLNYLSEKFGIPDLENVEND